MADLTNWKCYAITTADRPERGRRLEAELERLGLAYSIHRGERPPEPMGFENAATRGCFESHLLGLRQAREEGVEVAVLVEDDVVAVRRFPERLNVLVDELVDVDWGMIYLGYLGGQSPVAHDTVFRVAPHIAETRGWEIQGTHLVAVSARWFDAIIEDFERRLEPGGHRIPPDGVLNEFRRDHGRSALLALPNLGRQGPSPSSITPKVGVRQRLLRRPAVGAIAWWAKRWWWDLQAVAPPSWWVRAWNVRAFRYRSSRPSRLTSEIAAGSSR